MSGRKDVLEMAGIRKKGKKNPKRGLWNYTEVNRVKVNMERTGESPQIGWIIRGGTFFGGGAHTGLSLHLSPTCIMKRVAFSLIRYFFSFFSSFLSCTTAYAHYASRHCGGKQTTAERLHPKCSAERERELRKSESSLYKNLSRPPGSFLFLPFSYILTSVASFAARGRSDFFCSFSSPLFTNN
jgi:hypothetical protein